ncbi:unnamed protein product [Aphanomyces euteiches]
MAEEGQHRPHTREETKVCESMEIEATSKENLNGNPHIDISVRLGKRDDPLLLIYARQFLERFGIPRGKSIVAAVGLKDRTSETFEVVINAIQTLIRQN